MVAFNRHGCLQLSWLPSLVMVAFNRHDCFHWLW